VSDALNNLLNHIRDGANRKGGKFDHACDDILNATDKLFNSMGNAGEMVRQAKILAQVLFIYIYIFFNFCLSTFYLYKGFRCF